VLNCHTRLILFAADVFAANKALHTGGTFKVRFVINCYTCDALAFVVCLAVSFTYQPTLPAQAVQQQMHPVSDAAQKVFKVCSLLQRAAVTF
jgi:hypothetical protein